MSAGLERAGFECVLAVEYDKHAAATLRRNRPQWNVAEHDIRAIDFSIMKQLDIDLIAGGPACQPYSIEGKGLGKDDPRDVVPECLRAVREVRPRVFMFENVEGLLHGKHSSHLADILRGFRKAGYRNDIHRALAADYGIAQMRRRILIIGIRDDIPGMFRMPPRFPGRRANVGDVLLDLMAANGWSGAREWARLRREHPMIENGVMVAHGARDEESTFLTLLLTFRAR